MGRRRAAAPPPGDRALRIARSAQARGRCASIAGVSAVTARADVAIFVPFAAKLSFARPARRTGGRMDIKGDPRSPHLSAWGMGVPEGLERDTMALSGVRSSWLMLETNCDLFSLAGAAGAVTFISVASAGVALSGDSLVPGVAVESVVRRWRFAPS